MQSTIVGILHGLSYVGVFLAGAYTPSHPTMGAIAAVVSLSAGVSVKAIWGH